jgi:hypothetical protein
MDAELKKKWVEALRSGEYCQTREVLTDGAGFCCLGVLCEVQGIKKSDLGHYFYAGELVNDLGATDDDTFQVGGLTAQRRDKLAGMNDNGQSFEEIADWIEENL